MKNHAISAGFFPSRDGFAAGCRWRRSGSLAPAARRLATPALPAHGRAIIRVIAVIRARLVLCGALTPRLWHMAPGAGKDEQFIHEQNWQKP
jgi:hypothetical protein